jgi:hypothetical protein
VTGFHTKLAFYPTDFSGSEGGYQTVAQRLAGLLKAQASDGDVGIGHADWAFVMAERVGMSTRRGALGLIIAGNWGGD